MSSAVTEPAVSADSTAFTPQQQDLLRALAAGASKVDAARAANIHRDTANRWEHNLPGFHEAVLQAQAEYRASLGSQVRRLSLKAVDQLEQLLDNPDTPPSVRFRAIQLVLTRPRFPDKEWALPENLQPEPIQKVQESMALIEAETKSMLQYDKLKAQNVENVERLRDHFPLTKHIPISTAVPSDENPAPSVENVESVELPERHFSTSHQQPATSHGDSSTARNAPCPCGSGQKYKRCCGKSAPPVLHTKAKEAA